MTDTLRQEPESNEENDAAKWHEFINDQNGEHAVFRARGYNALQSYKKGETLSDTETTVVEDALATMESAREKYRAELGIDPYADDFEREQLIVDKIGPVLADPTGQISELSNTIQVNNERPPEATK